LKSTDVASIVPIVSATPLSICRISPFFQREHRIWWHAPLNRQFAWFMMWRHFTECRNEEFGIDDGKHHFQFLSAGMLGNMNGSFTPWMVLYSQRKKLVEGVGKHAQSTGINVGAVNYGVTIFDRDVIVAPLASSVSTSMGSPSSPGGNNENLLSGNVCKSASDASMLRCI